MNIPKKLKRHIANFFRFLGAYIVAEILLSLGQQFGLWEHYTLLQWSFGTVYFAVAGWFVWRGYTGMMRDCDFYDDD